MKNTISVCLLVNNETTFSRCLESAKNIADEIIIVDTSSNFINKKAALLYTDKYFRFKWINDFSKARNFAISKAKGDWIFSIDPDEYILNGEFIKKNLKEDKDAYFIKLYNLNSEGAVLCRDRVTRVFKNNMGFKFFGYIHEFVVDRNLKPLKRKSLLKGLIIYHTGYSDDTIRENKFIRNFKLLEKELKQSPVRKEIYFYLARNYFNQARFLILKQGKMTDSAVNLLIKSMEMSLHYKFISGNSKFKTDAKALYDLCNIALSFKRYKEVKNLLF